MYVYIYMYMCICLCMYAFLYVCMHTCMYYLHMVIGFRAKNNLTKYEPKGNSTLESMRNALGGAHCAPNDPNVHPICGLEGRSYCR